MEQSTEIRWSIDPASAEMFHALPLARASKELLGVLFVGSSQRDVVTLERRIRWLALGVVAVGVLFGLLLSWWGAARVTRPVQKLAEGAQEVAEGNWSARVDVRGRDEVGQLAASFNRDDRAIDGAARQAGAGGARGGMAGIGAAPRARTEESAISAADDRGKFASARAEIPDSSRKCFTNPRGYCWRKSKI